MDDVNVTKSYLTPDAMAAGGVLPQPIPASEAINMMTALKTAFPDLKFDVQNVTVKGNQATVQAKWSGTNKGPLNMPLPGMKSIPPTGKHVSVKDTYIVTVQGDKVSRLEVELAARWRHPGRAESDRRQSTGHVARLDRLSAGLRVRRTIVRLLGAVHFLDSPVFPTAQRRLLVSVGLKVKNQPAGRNDCLESGFSSSSRKRARLSCAAEVWFCGPAQGGTREFSSRLTASTSALMFF